MSDASQALQACPFCGSGASVAGKEGVTLYRHAGGTAWQAICDQCAASTREGRTKEDAAAWWNARADLVPDRAQMQRVTAALLQYREAPFRSADWLAGELMTICDTAPANDCSVAKDGAGAREARTGLKRQYPDYIDDPDGLERFRQDVLTTPGHDMAKVNHNSLGRLIDTIDRLRAERDAALSPALDNTAVEGLRALVQEMLDNLKQCSLDSGCCHCGDSMDRHAEPMVCGHTPVDMGWAAAEAWIGKAEAALVGGEYAK